MRQEIRLAGFGGQGVISMGIIIANAAGRYEGKQVAQTQSYGPEARGGACKTEVVISETEIDYIKALNPDVLVAMSQPALDKNSVDLDPKKSILIIDDTMINSIPDGIKKLYRISATKIADEELEFKVGANVFMLGAFAKITGLVSPESCKKALEQNINPRFITKNLEVFEAGYNYASHNF